MPSMNISNILNNPDILDSNKKWMLTSSNEIVIYDGKIGDVLYIMADDKTSDNHKMAIIGVCWIDNNTLGNCSLDRTIKVWDINEKACKYTLYPNEKNGLDIPDSGCGIATSGVYLISLSLKGCLNFWEVSTLSNEKLPDRTIDGHQSYISDILYLAANSQIISSDTTGKIILWNSKDEEYVKTMLSSECLVVKMAISPDENTLYCLNNRGVIKGLDITSSAEL